MAYTLSLNIGKGENDTYWLVLSNPDTRDIYPIAQFADKIRMEAFTMWMETQGYSAMTMPSDDELSEFLK